MAKTVKLQELKKIYEFACNEYVQKFCNKHQFEFDGWVGDEIGGVALFCSQYSFNFSDILFDLNTKQPKHQILKWQNESVEVYMSNKINQYINYKSYSMGLRYEQLK